MRQAPRPARGDRVPGERPPHVDARHYTQRRHAPKCRNPGHPWIRRSEVRGAPESSGRRASACEAGADFELGYGIFFAFLIATIIWLYDAFRPVYDRRLKDGGA